MAWGPAAGGLVVPKRYAGSVTSAGRELSPSRTESVLLTCARRAGAGLLGLGLLGVMGGCVQRTIVVTSEPSGALVWLNDQEVGRTPVEVPFTFYGTYDVRLEKAGHSALWTTGKADPPWWEYPGPDLVAELMPWGPESRVAWHYRLSTVAEAEAAAARGVVDRESGSNSGDKSGGEADGGTGAGGEAEGEAESGATLVERARLLRRETRAESDF